MSRDLMQRKSLYLPYYVGIFPFYIQFAKWKQELNFRSTKINFFLPNMWKRVLAKSKYTYYSDSGDINIKHVQ
jgi:hypothetical protein